MNGHCGNCQALFEMGKNVFTEAGVRETRISGYCEKCFDTICDEEPSEEEYYNPHEEAELNDLFPEFGEGWEDAGDDDGFIPF